MLKGPMSKTHPFQVAASFSLEENRALTAAATAEGMRVTDYIRARLGFPAISPYASNTRALVSHALAVPEVTTASAGVVTGLSASGCLYALNRLHRAGFLTRKAVPRKSGKSYYVYAATPALRQRQAVG